MSGKGISLCDLNERLSGDREARNAIGKIDPEVNDYYCSIMKQTFPQVFKAERDNDLGRLSFLLDIYYLAAKGSMRQIDESGLTAAIGRMAVELEEFSFEENAPNLVLEHLYLTKNLGIPDHKVRHLWPFVDRHKHDIIHRMSEPGFCLESLIVERQR